MVSIYKTMQQVVDAGASDFTVSSAGGSTPYLEEEDSEQSKNHHLPLPLWLEQAVEPPIAEQSRNVTLVSEFEEVMFLRFTY